jgi:phenylacetic acid degradation operon negative regulatory protein
VSKSDDLLILLLSGLEVLMRPSPSNILRFLDPWDNQDRLRRQLWLLERSRFVEKCGRGPASTIQLTESGREAARGGVDPVRRWQRAWDGKWRLLLFDLPARNQQLRLRLWRWLRSQRFGFLQLSVWVTPDAVNETRFPLRNLELTPESLTVMESKPVAPDSDADIAKAAWDFPLINRRYQEAIDSMEEGLAVTRRTDTKRAHLRHWLAAERQTWLAAVSTDPFLPEALLPADYLGRRAWTKREATFAELGRA